MGVLRLQMPTLTARQHRRVAVTASGVALMLLIYVLFIHEPYYPSDHYELHENEEVTAIVPVDYGYNGEVMKPRKVKEMLQDNEPRHEVDAFLRKVNAGSVDLSAEQTTVAVWRQWLLREDPFGN